MGDARELLEQYSDERCSHVSVNHDAGGGRYVEYFKRWEFAPEAFDALRAVLDRHKPRAVISFDYGQRRHVDVQQCAECADHCHSRSGLGCDSPDAPWPCDTVRDITAALRGGS